VRKPEFLSELITREIIGSTYAQLVAPFGFYSAILGREFWAPIGFIQDYESVPFFKATSKYAGVGHDYLCRIDSDPVVTKKVAAQVYLEMMTCRDEILYAAALKNYFAWWQRAAIELKRADRFNRRWAKYDVVRVWPGYFHRLPVMATLEQIKAA